MFLFFAVHILAEKSMFPVSISPYLAGVAPLYLSIRDEVGERKVIIVILYVATLN